MRRPQRAMITVMRRQAARVTRWVADPRVKSLSAMSSKGENWVNRHPNSRGKMGKIRFLRVQGESCLLQGWTGARRQVGSFCRIGGVMDLSAKELIPAFVEGKKVVSLE